MTSFGLHLVNVIVISMSISFDLTCGDADLREMDCWSWPLKGFFLGGGAGDFGIILAYPN